MEITWIRGDGCRCWYCSLVNDPVRSRLLGPCRQVAGTWGCDFNCTGVAGCDVNCTGVAGRDVNCTGVASSAGKGNSEIQQQVSSQRLTTLAETTPGKSGKSFGRICWEERQACASNTVSVFAWHQKRVYHHLGFSFEKQDFLSLLLCEGLPILQNLLFPFWYFPSLWLSRAFKQRENIDFCYFEGVQITNQGADISSAQVSINAAADVFFRVDWAVEGS